MLYLVMVINTLTGEPMFIVYKEGKGVRKRLNTQRKGVREKFT